jgi:hypothetical protein
MHRGDLVAGCGRPDLKQKLYRYVRGELGDPADREGVELHLRECADCTAVHGELQWLLGTMRRPGGAGYEQEVARELAGILRGGTAAPAKHGSGWLARLKHRLSTARVTKK